MPLELQPRDMLQIITIIVGFVASFIALREGTNKNTESITELKKIVTNGLAAKVRDIAEDVAYMKGRMEERE